jgi:hypothetical protein
MPGSPPAQLLDDDAATNAMAGAILTVDDLVARVVAGVEANEQYILTHEDSLGILENRAARLERAATRVTSGRNGVS